MRPATQPTLRAGMLRMIAALATGFALFAPPLPAEQVLVAVASNFSAPMQALKTSFEHTSAVRLAVSIGSTGKQYAQIVNGAPFDIFLAADSQRPERLVSEGHAVAGSLATYAIGRLVLWSPDPDLVDPEGSILARGNFRHLAIANPILAPYGEAAVQTLASMGLLEPLTPRLVRGENINQAFQFIRSGNAELGFIARSQWRGLGRPAPGSAWLVPAGLHQPIVQQAVILSDSEGARAFMAFLGSEPAADIIRQHGYDLPDAR